MVIVSIPHLKKKKRNAIRKILRERNHRSYLEMSTVYAALSLGIYNIISLNQIYKNQSICHFI